MPKNGGDKESSVVWGPADLRWGHFSYLIGTSFAFDDFQVPSIAFPSNLKGNVVKGRVHTVFGSLNNL
jgi:hypothetical protein